MTHGISECCMRAASLNESNRLAIMAVAVMLSLSVGVAGCFFASVSRRDMRN